ncbi:GH25 family lysozyme [Eupransor demetentiae]|uniref:Glucan-binding domain (YG repeat) n=1 Tax=Eupransor demetentiae TaxID=3109584 RepID=A0ABM9N3E5_9LACO|nr:Glucan-binding domain (YG repeat) [Lactobacillaceae bacterium LMG 33000]
MKIKTILLTCASVVALGGVAAAQNTTTASADGIPVVVAGTPGLPNMDVVDISSYNGVLSVSDFQKMRQAGVTGIVIKITEYTTYKNPYAEQQIQNAQAAGMKVGVYHYSWYTTPAEARAEADYFANYAAQLGLPASTLMVDDLEDATTKTANVSQNAAAFNDELKADGFYNTGLYTYTSYVNQTGLDMSYIGNDRVWMAQFPYEPSSSNLKNTQFAMWQWSSRATFPGVSGEFDVSTDYNALAGTHASSRINSDGTSNAVNTTTTANPNANASQMVNTDLFSQILNSK